MATKSKNGKVAPKSQAAEDLRSLFEEQLKDIYWAEKALTKALPKMAKNATAPELVDALNEHLEITRSQVQRVEEVFGIIGKKAQAKKCEAMEGLLNEAEAKYRGMIHEPDSQRQQIEALRDAGLRAHALAREIMQALKYTDSSPASASE
jgi:ferritin-like metal-binding protein YciE